MFLGEKHGVASICQNLPLCEGRQKVYNLDIQTCINLYSHCILPRQSVEILLSLSISRVLLY